MLSNSEIKQKLIECNISTISLQFVDSNGGVRSLDVPFSQLDKILSNKISFDGSSMSLFRQNETKDLFLHPDLSTFLIYPTNVSSLSHSARFICDVYTADGVPYEGCPRSNLKRVIALAEEAGYSMKIGPEIEFFLFKVDKDMNVIDAPTVKTGYYDLNVNYDCDELLVNILDILEKLGFNIKAIHHEGAPYQHEIDLGYDDILKTADNILTFKFITKVLAENHGFKASFMPKPVYGQNGSGLHLNISLEKNNKNIFHSDVDEYNLSSEARSSIASLLKNIKGITAVLNPTINSYKRLVKDYEAPIYIVWSVVTRSALIRIPSKRGNSSRLELRSPDAAMNPYIAFAVILQTCIDGIRNKFEPPKPIEKNLFQLSSNEIKQRKIKSLPRNLFTALEEFEKSMVAKVALGDFIFTEFLYSKRKEWNDYRKQVTPWELKKYLDV